MKPKRPEGVRSFIRKAAHFLRRAAPHLGLMLIYVIYLMLGALAFCSLEHGTEAVKYQDEMERCKGEIKDILMNMSNDNMTAREGKRELEDKLDEFTKIIMRPEWKEGRIQSNMVNRTFSLFASSVLFCMTTITTIGYGDIVPTTTGGRSFCIVYALFGIPLTLLCLADIGDLLARLVLWACQKLGINKCCRRIQDECSRSQPDSDFTMDHTHVIKETMPNHSSKDEETDIDKSVRVDIHENIMRKQGGCAADMAGGASAAPSHRPSAAASHRHKGGVCTKEGGCQKEEVPILVIIFLQVTYVCLGSVLLVLSEGWSFGIGIYFTIITLTTIGFGDFVPSNIYARHGFVIQIAFTLLGMAMMSMTIALLKNKVVRFFTYLYNKLNA